MVGQSSCVPGCRTSKTTRLTGDLTVQLTSSSKFKPANKLAAVAICYGILATSSTTLPRLSKLCIPELTKSRARLFPDRRRLSNQMDQSFLLMLKCRYRPHIVAKRCVKSTVNRLDGSFEASSENGVANAGPMTCLLRNQALTAILICFFVASFKLDAQTPSGRGMQHTAASGAALA